MSTLLEDENCWWVLTTSTVLFLQARWEDSLERSLVLMEGGLVHHLARLEDK